MASAPEDRSSLSSPNVIAVKHIDWEVTVDFDASILHGSASYTLEYVTPGSRVVRLDTNFLKIFKVVDPATGEALSFTHHPGIPNKSYLGRQLSISLPTTSIEKVKVFYQTTKQSSAVQWLPPEQTAGAKHPYLFTQCQAIHARALIPCQDRPGIKATYSAKVTVPSWATCVMSAVMKKEETNDKTKIFYWDQPVPISSYLIAMAVGELTKIDISERCAVWSEPSVVKQAAWEFSQTEDFLKIAEEIAGKPYVWGRYDLLCLPPSFPYGGMENPCLTFVTPTLLAGDRSLADVVAHEIAHSWTGNLVTNSTWDHFWLNEGWTTWFQRKIMARIHKDDKFLHFDAIGGYKTLTDTIKREVPDEFSRLVLDVGDLDPDDSYSSVAYEKGFNLLFALETRVGTPEFEKFFQAYVSKFASKTVTSEEFRAFFNQHFKTNAKVKDFDWNTWFYSSGMPPEKPQFDRTLAEASEKLAIAWFEVDRSGNMVPSVNLKDWSSDQITCFLDALLDLCEDQPLKLDTLKAMKQQYGFESTKNSEVLFRFCELAIASEDKDIVPIALRFVTTQGRMKFTRPLYKALFRSKMASDLAVETFLANKHIYHPICTKMVASDLSVSVEEKASILESPYFKVSVVVAAVAVVAGFVLMRKR
ncbi:Leukotriene A-4 hydrolase [Seminavis robusta]|uniref:Leukotriene A-4 hydrolase n=1 Tax=Seminavis robusta TaxID=568900 RepID=A0A9N8EWX3_9STRA|nr:Leukotriene A-4 hydrolase [Seminavis robusta]|eukprot:Sro1796_g298110.1 Leukotriene A-4 hydrolase (645) ;mRNA; f:10101-12347